MNSGRPITARTANNLFADGKCDMQEQKAYRKQIAT
jgi:hypothetical protein